MVLFWVSIPIAVLIVLAAVGIPYWISHRHARPHDYSEGQAYLQARDNTAEGAATGQPGQPIRQPGTGSQPTGSEPWV